MGKWKDTTSYSYTKGQRRGEVEPRAWTLELPGRYPLTIVVHRYHGCDGWFVSCRQAGVDSNQLASLDLHEAKLEALDAVQARVLGWARALEAAHADAD